jgi:RND superfamily putative drug exporter
VLVAWVLLLGIAGGGAALFMKGTDNSFSIPGTEAQEGIELLDRSFPQASGTSAQLVVVAADGDAVDVDPYASSIADSIAEFEDLDGVIAVTDPFDEMVTGLVSDDESAAIIRLQFDGQATDVTEETTTALEQVAHDLRGSLPDGSQVALGGDLFSTSVPALSIIEAVGVLIALFVLIVTFRSFAVAWFPLASALIGVGLAIALIYFSTAFASISSTTPMLAVMLGLAVGIDYALFIVARHQDQVRVGVDPEESAARATGTSGSAVVFAGVTVLIALVGLGFAGIPFLTTMGIAAAVAVAIAVVVAITLTPAFLGFSKGRVVGWGHKLASAGMPLPRQSRKTQRVSSRSSLARSTTGLGETTARSTTGSTAATESDERQTADDPDTAAAQAHAGLEHTSGRAGAHTQAANTRDPDPNPATQQTHAREQDPDESTLPTQRGIESKTNGWVRLVTKHPLITTLAVVLTLGVMAIPAASLALALPNAGVQPESSQARQAYDLTAEHFGPGANGPLIMTGTIVTSTDPLGLLEDLADEIEQVPGVKEIALATPNETADTGLIQIVPETAPDDPATADLVRALRDLAPQLQDEYGVDLKVTGFTAVGIDISDRLGAALLPFGIFVVGLSLILLMIVFRSIWVPVTAALGYLLSVAASFGAVAAVFEWGWFADLLHVTRTGPVISFMPIILMGVLFGLAMDYQVFLVSRMREDFVHARRAAAGRTTLSARDLALGAVRSGFTASARVVTAAAVIMFAVFAAFVPEGDSSIKPIALGLAVGIAVDAFLVRMTLVPAVMALLGARAWWMPRWLERVLPHFDIEGEAVERELSLADWPEPHSAVPTPTPLAAGASGGASGRVGPAIVGDGVAVRADGGRELGEVVLLEDAAFRVEPGGTLIATGDPRSARAFALTIAGRLTPSEGRLRVAGHLLPERAAWVRAHVGVALLADAEDRVQALRRALGSRARLVVIDGADVLDAAERDQAAALLHDSAEALRAGAEADARLTLVVTARSESAVLALLADAHRADVSSLALRAGTTQTTTTAEVTA